MECILRKYRFKSFHLRTFEIALLIIMFFLCATALKSNEGHNYCFTISQIQNTCLAEVPSMKFKARKINFEFHWKPIYK